MKNIFPFPCYTKTTTYSHSLPIIKQRMTDYVLKQQDTMKIEQDWHGGNGVQHTIIIPKQALNFFNIGIFVPIIHVELREYMTNTIVTLRFEFQKGYVIRACVWMLVFQMILIKGKVPKPIMIFGPAGTFIFIYCFYIIGFMISCRKTQKTMHESLMA